MGIHHGVSKKDEPDKHIFEVYRKFFSVSNEKVDGGEAVQKKRKEADLDGIIIFVAYILIVLFTLLPRISSIVYKKGCSMSASNKLPFSFP